MTARRTTHDTNDASDTTYPHSIATASQHVHRSRGNTLMTRLATAIAVASIAFATCTMLEQAVLPVDAYVDQLATGGYRRCWGIYGTKGKKQSWISPDFAHILQLSDDDMDKIIGGDGSNTMRLARRTDINSTVDDFYEQGVVEERTGNTNVTASAGNDTKADPPVAKKPLKSPALLPNTERYSVAIYNYDDEPSFLTDHLAAEICGSQDTVTRGACKEEDEGKFIIQTANKPIYPYINEVVIVGVGKSTPAETKYIVQSTGYYCALVIPTDYDNNIDGLNNVVNIEIVQSIGLIPGLHYPKVYFYLGLALVYIILGGLWVWQMRRFWHKILKLQIYIGATFCYIALEMAVNYAFFLNYNRTGHANRVWLSFAAALNAGRVSLCFFLLLLVSLGYGVVRPTLGTSLFRKILILTGLHFVFGIVYAVATLLWDKFTILLILTSVLPLSICMTVFYFWILHAISATREQLKTTSQTIKLGMYDKLNRILMFSFMLVFAFFIMDVFYFMDQASDDWWQIHWKTRWFMLDGWLNFLFLVVFCMVTYLWRPNTKNERYGLMQLSSNEDENIGTFVNGDDDDMDELENIEIGTRGMGGDKVVFDGEAEMAAQGEKIGGVAAGAGHGTGRGGMWPGVDDLDDNGLGDEDAYTEVDTTQPTTGGGRPAWHNAVDDMEDDAEGDLQDLQRRGWRDDV